MKMNWTLIILVLMLLCLSSIRAEVDTLKIKIDSMFVIASSGDFKFREMVDPTIEDMASLGEAAVPYLIERLDTRDPRERVTLENIFKKIGQPAVPLLNDALLESDSLKLARVALILYYLPDTSAVENLIKISENDYYQARYQVIRALGKIGDMRAKAVIEKAMADSIELVRTMAVVAAGRLGAGNFASGLMEALSDDYYGVRMAALEELKQLNCDARRKFLIPYLEKTNSSIARKLLLSILAESLCAYEAETFKEFLADHDPVMRALALKAAYRSAPDSIYAYLQNNPGKADNLYLKQVIQEIKSDHEKKKTAKP